jgi:hypothetical protein
MCSQTFWRRDRNRQRAGSRAGVDRRWLGLALGETRGGQQPHSWLLFFLPRERTRDRGYREADGGPAARQGRHRAPTYLSVFASHLHGFSVPFLRQGWSRLAG